MPEGWQAAIAASLTGDNIGSTQAHGDSPRFPEIHGSPESCHVFPGAMSGMCDAVVRWLQKSGLDKTRKWVGGAVVEGWMKMN